jgi:vacuolar-type H+-ATPase subunit I/STV1
MIAEHRPVFRSDLSVHSAPQPADLVLGADQLRDAADALKAQIAGLEEFRATAKAISERMRTVDRVHDQLVALEHRLDGVETFMGFAQQTRADMQKFRVEVTAMLRAKTEHIENLPDIAAMLVERSEAIVTLSDGFNVLAERVARVETLAPLTDNVRAQVQLLRGELSELRKDMRRALDKAGSGG